MNAIRDVIPNITSYLPIVGHLRGVSRSWENSINMLQRQSIEILNSEYDGINLTAEGEEYSTLYTKLRQAILDGDVDIVRDITSTGGYLPIPWDLLAVDIGVENLRGGDNNPNMNAIHRLISPRWSPRALALYDIIVSEGLNEQSNIPLRHYMSFIDTEDSDYSTIYTLNYMLNSLINLKDTDIDSSSLPENILFYMGMGRYLSPQTIADLVMSDIPAMEKQLDTHNRTGFLYPSIGLYLNRNVEGNVLERTRGIIPRVIFTGRISVPDERVYPYAPFYIGIDHILLYDRQDILDIRYDDPMEMINHILDYLVNARIHPDIVGSRVKEYIRNMDIDWNRVRSTINPDYHQYLQYLV